MFHYLSCHSVHFPPSLSPFIPTPTYLSSVVVVWVSCFQCCFICGSELRVYCSGGKCRPRREVHDPGHSAEEHRAERCTDSSPEPQMASCYLLYGTSEHCHEKCTERLSAQNGLRNSGSDACLMALSPPGRGVSQEKLLSTASGSFHCETFLLVLFYWWWLSLAVLRGLEPFWVMLRPDHAGDLQGHL